MRFEIDYLKEHHVSRLTMSGIMVLREYRGMILSIMAEMEARHTRKLIVDLRHVTLSLSLTDTATLPDINQELGVGDDYRVAMIFMEHSPKATGVKLYEILAAHRGYDHKLFTRYPAALLWFLNQDKELMRVAM
ncbi:hypothetical protein LG201_12665 [Methylobacillus gramineus]|uniref:hypothetical protein n=1 Tax=Methylobacillus gramineus TaxID=755169 RepID=UPI001D000A1E|nr:hypothetical protein [Methylobacillus gramineus]MCB5186059.1 hypothetical protein [Methylobacillus gramineus]